MVAIKPKRNVYWILVKSYDNGRRKIGREKAIAVEAPSLNERVKRLIKLNLEQCFADFGQGDVSVGSEKGTCSACPKGLCMKRSDQDTGRRVGEVAKAKEAGSKL